MKVYIVTRTDARWDCVRGVFGSEDSLINYLNSLELEYEEEETITFKDFTGMSIDEIDEYLCDNEEQYVVHEEEVQ